jgi:hypothetical protein
MKHITVFKSYENWCCILAQFKPFKPKRERERVRKDNIRVEVKRKHLGESERRFISGGGKYLVRRYPGNARSSF